MSNSIAVDAARFFLDVVWNGDPPSDAEVLEALDYLLFAHHQTPKGEMSRENCDPPREDWGQLRKKVAERCPRHGYYPCINPSTPLEEMKSFGKPAKLDGDVMVADAIDDIADITLDMRGFLWRAEHLGVDYAHYYFRQLYFHWGKHARELSTYLDALLYHPYKADDRPLGERIEDALDIK